MQEVRCRSSVVEHSLGKGEVDSSILSGSTMQDPLKDIAISAFFAVAGVLIAVAIVALFAG